MSCYDEVKEQDYNLSVSSYVEAEDTREKIDIVKLNAEIKEIVAREQILRDEIDKIIAELARVKGIPLRNAMDIYYNSRLSAQISDGSYGIDNMDYRYLVQDLIDNEPELLMTGD